MGEEGREREEEEEKEEKEEQTLLIEQTRCTRECTT